MSSFGGVSPRHSATALKMASTIALCGQIARGRHHLDEPLGRELLAVRHSSPRTPRRCRTRTRRRRGARTTPRRKSSHGTSPAAPLAARSARTLRRAADRIRQAGVGERDGAPFQIEDRVAQRAVILFELTLVQDRVHRRQHARGTRSLGKVAPAERAAAHQLGRERAVERRRDAFARHVADSDDQRCSSPAPGIRESPRPARAPTQTRRQAPRPSAAWAAPRAAAPPGRAGRTALPSPAAPALVRTSS